MKIIEVDFNVITGKETVIEREETLNEKNTREKREAEFAAIDSEIKAKATAKTALLKKLGITEAEAELLNA